MVRICGMECLELFLSEPVARCVADTHTQPQHGENSFTAWRLVAVPRALPSQDAFLHAFAFE